MIKNLQKVLNSDKRLGVKIKEDGKWGEETKRAVMKLQETYGIDPVDGWIGSATKKKLDQLAKYVKPSKEKGKKRVSMLKKKSTKGYTTNTFAQKLRNFRRQTPLE